MILEKGGTMLTLLAAVKFVEGNPAGTPINEEAFDKACGVGMSYTVWNDRSC
jgi:hypothetical protein